jgi:hypothetical protein
MYFEMKNILKNNRNYISKQIFKYQIGTILCPLFILGIELMSRRLLMILILFFIQSQF